MVAKEASEAFDDGLDFGPDAEMIAPKVDLRGKAKPKRAQTNFDPEGLDPVTIDELFRAAHDLRGEASTFGYPLIGEVCGSLCHLIDASPDGRFLPAALIAQHVQAVRAMVAEKAKDDTNATARRLVGKLTEVTREYASRVSGPA